MSRIPARLACLAALAPAALALAAPDFCGTEGCAPETLGRHPVTLGAQDKAARGLRGPCAEDGSEIDILIVYTPDAATAAGGAAAIETLANDSIAELNAAFGASSVPTTAVLVGVEPLAQNESGASSTDLARLRSQTDGYFDEVHALRDTLHADLVSMFVANSDVCGRAYIGVLPGAVGFEDLGFSVVAQSCATVGVHAFAHEIGHNLGLVHDAIETPCETGARPWARGYVAPDDSFETVMGVSGTGTRELVFSTPDVVVNAQPAGVMFDQPNGADASLALLDSTAVVAKFRNKDLNNDGECDADQILAGTLTDCDSNGVPDDYDPDFNRNGTPDACDIAAGTSLDADLDGVPDEVEVPVLYVNANATASTESGTSWANAMTDLQDAFALANASGDVQEIWVASGTYRPGPPGARAMTFRFANGVAVRGGFAGTEAEQEERDAANAPTILSADLNGDDGPAFTNRSDNAFHAGYVRDFDQRVTLDRLTFAGGNADMAVNCSVDNTGGGLLTLFTDVLIRDCTFTDSEAYTGAGAAIQDQTKIRIVGSDFTSNRTTDPLALTSSGIFQTKGYAPGVYFSGDKTGDDNIMLNCRVMHNESTGGTSGVFAIGGQPTIAGCLIAHNTGTSIYGNEGLYIRLADGARVINTTVADNTGPNSYTYNTSGCVISVNNAVVTNSIFWNNTSGGAVTPGGQLTISSAVTGVNVDRVIAQGWDGSIAGVGSGDDPMFADAAAGDYALLAGSPAIDAGDNAYVPADGADADLDGDVLEPLPLDLAGAPRFADDPSTPDTGAGSAPIVDLGPYEFAGAPACPCDLDGSGVLNLDDINLFAQAFVSAQPLADIDDNGSYNLDDINLFAQCFVAGCP